jgi:hypothetical protein
MAVKRYLASEMISIPTPPLLHDTNDFECCIVTIVPGQVKDAAIRRNHLPYHAHCDTWVASEGFTAETERNIEVSYYYNDSPDYIIAEIGKQEDGYISEDGNQEDKLMMDGRLLVYHVIVNLISVPR